MLRTIVAVGLAMSLSAYSIAVVHAGEVVGGQGSAVPTVAVSDVCPAQMSYADCLNLRVNHPGSGAAKPAALTIPQPPPPPTCHYESMFKYTAPSSVQDGSPDQPAQVDVQKEVCPSGVQSVGTPINFAPIAPASTAVTTKALEDQALATLAMSPPQVSLSPDANSTQFVGVPLWLWTPAPAWVPKSVTVSAGGVSLTMTATPVSTVWSMGDGGTVTCRGPGSPYPASRTARPPEKSPDCGYEYSSPSMSQPGAMFPVSATTRWKVSWSTSSGLSGTEPDLTATSRLALHVSEIQALVTNVRP